MFEEMAGNKTGRKTLGINSLQRSRLSNITNLVNGGSWSNENERIKGIYYTSECQLQQEIKKLEQMNAEKDLIIAGKDQEIESQKLFMHKMQRDFYSQHLQASSAERGNHRLQYPPLQAKMLHHEYTQMTLIYKINESELQTRLAETQVQKNRVSEEKKKASYDLMNPDENSIHTTRRTPSARRHSMMGGGSS